MDNYEYDIVRTVLLTPISICILALIGLLPVIYLKIVKPFDKLFYGKGLTFEEGVWFASAAMRMAQYTLCIVFPERSKKDKYAKLVYKGFDFRGSASQSQIILSYLYLFLGVISMVLGAILIIYDFIIRPMVA